MINFTWNAWFNKIKLPILVSAFFMLSLLGGMSAASLSKAANAAELFRRPRPSVIFTNPKNRSGGILLNSKVSVKFNEAMDRNTFTAVSAYMKGQDGTVVSGTISFNGAGSVFTFVPSSALATGTRYTFTFTRRIKSAGEMHLLRKYSFSFTTAGDFIYAAEGNGNVSSWSVSGGKLSFSPSSIGYGEGADSVAIDPSGKYLYTANSNMGTVSSYSIYNGVLSHASLSTTARNSGFEPYHLTVDPSGRFIYVTDWNTGTASSFSVDKGVLLPHPVSVTAPTSSSFKGAKDVIVDPSGRYLYVTYYSTGNLSAYSIKDGMLSAEPVSEIGNANAMLSGDYSSIAITPPVFQHPGWTVNPASSQ